MSLILLIVALVVIILIYLRLASRAFGRLLYPIQNQSLQQLPSI
jgi:hypothetical protein